VTDLPRHTLRLLTYPDGSTIESDKDSLLVGRHSEADVRFPMPDISRHHCRFVRITTGWKVIDLASTNGTFVNGVRIEEAELRAGDRVRIGGIMFEMAGNEERMAS
jgi:pSer/pThr/pTyr-binding forkhead associated (FHA) protein